MLPAIPTAGGYSGCFKFPIDGTLLFQNFVDAPVATKPLVVFPRFNGASGGSRIVLFRGPHTFQQRAAGFPPAIPYAGPDGPVLFTP